MKWPQVCFVAAYFAIVGATEAYAQNAMQCVQIVHGNSSGAFFKSKVWNSCSVTISLAWCEVARCGISASYYDSRGSIPPGGSEPVDTRGGGIRYAACVHGGPNWGPRSDKNGRFTC